MPFLRLLENDGYKVMKILESDVQPEYDTDRRDMGAAFLGKREPPAGCLWLASDAGVMEW